MLLQCVPCLSDLSAFAIKNGYDLPFIIFLKSKNTYKILKQIAVACFIYKYYLQKAFNRCCLSCWLIKLSRSC